MQKKAALYDPYLATLGGGERHILSILQVLDGLGYQVDIFWDTDLTSDIEKKLNITFQNKLRFIPNIFGNRANQWDKLKELKKYDYFFYVTDGSYFFSSARHNYVFCMVPEQNLYKMTFLNKLKLWNYKFICNSKFTRDHLVRWGVNAKVVYPYIEADLNVVSEPVVKKDIVLCVGRFFSQLHSKRQDIAIEYFQYFKKHHEKEFGDFTLILAGGLQPEDAPYFEKLKEMAGSDLSIIFKPNCGFRELRELYASARIFWHFAGYGINDAEAPEKVEHFGITPIEAMIYGCIPFCYAAGGPKEIIRDDQNGYLFTTKEELWEKLHKLLSDSKKEREMRDFMIKDATHAYSKEIFTKIVEDVLGVTRTI